MASTARGIQKIFVGNLNWTIGHQELRKYFTEFGRVLKANKAGLLRGYGFVAFKSNSNILQKIENKSRLEGQRLTIQKAA